ncbi:MAG: hypothetical protein NTW54_06195 [Bacteroidetes bacterium]|nr:hypothetical protein [Bacteroidota bacterium]
MITIQGVYDGVKIIPTQNISGLNSSRVEITFLEELETSLEEQMHNFVSNSIFNFWGNERDEREVNNLNEK